MAAEYEEQRARERDAEELRRVEQMKWYQKIQEGWDGYKERVELRRRAREAEEAMNIRAVAELWDEEFGRRPRIRMGLVSEMAS